MSDFVNGGALWQVKTSGVCCLPLSATVSHPGGRSGYHAKKGKLSEALVGPASADGHQGAAESNAQWLPRHAMALDVSICEQHQIEEEKVPAQGTQEA